jgi:hypothetical protein
MRDGVQHTANSIDVLNEVYDTMMWICIIYIYSQAITVFLDSDEVINYNNCFFLTQQSSGNFFFLILELGGPSQPHGAHFCAYYTYQQIHRWCNSRYFAL